MRLFVAAMRLLVAPIMLVASLLVTAPQANAYTLEGPRWPGQPAAGSCCANLTWRNFAGDSIDNAAGFSGTNAWTNSAALIIYKTALASMINYYEANVSGVSWDGMTTWTTYVGGNGVTYFHTGMSVQVNHYYLRNYSAAKAQSVSAHEFGHAAGLGHVSTCELMNGSTNTRYSATCGYINTPQGDDDNGVNHLY